ncbi:molybdate ABC transporter substrate-binding protein [Agaribacter marinus]|uniref:Molybdate ABC transporter substrate-binding protein n=2 Tax=Agaribacter marinus TaxID=1431249 RepID=A0AA37SUF0_9ALTE|nr:molybdate ABC transporter substrate-binding protein [Agaribacter marinus]
MAFALVSVLTVFGAIFAESAACAKENATKADKRIKTEISLTVAVASNFFVPLQHLLELPSAPKELNVKLVVGSSGSLYAQAIHGAPFDIFLAADKDRPQSLAKKQSNRAVPFTYAYGRLVIYPAEQGMRLAKLNEAKRVAIANPKLAPYGQSAHAFLAKQNISEPKIVYGNNVSHAFQFADTGNVDFSITAESLLIHAFAISKKQKYRRYLSLPANTYPQIEQQGIILIGNKRDAHLSAAEVFVDFLLSGAAQSRLSTLGYEPVSSSVPGKLGLLNFMVGNKN